MWKPWWDFWVRLSGELASLRGSSKRLFVALYRLFVRSKSPVRKCERRLGLESLEYRKYLSAVVNIQPLIVTAGNVAELRVTLKGAITTTAVINYSLANGTAMLGSDYVAPPQGKIVFLPGEPTTQEIVVPTQADSSVLAKWFTASLLDPTGGVTLGRAQAQCTILEPPASSATPPGGFADTQPRQGNNDSSTNPVVTTAVGCCVDEGGTAEIPISLSQVCTSDVTVDFYTSDGTASAGLNYSAAWGSATISAGQSCTSIPVTTIDDNLYEQNEGYLWLNLSGVSGANAVLGPTSACSVNINNIDPAPSVSIVGPSSVVNEGNDADLGVILSQAAGAPVTIFYNTSDGTATSGENYYGLSSSTIIPTGSTSTTISVATRDDGVYAPGADYFCVTLSEVDGADMGSPNMTTVAIQNSAWEPSANISGPTGALYEGGTALFQVTLTGKSDAPTFVDYQSQDGSAKANTDYQPVSGEVSIPPGSTTAPIPVNIVDKGSIEANERDFSVNLTSVSGACMGWCSVASATIQPVGASISGDAVAGEGSPYTLNLQASNLGNLTIDHWNINWGDGSPEQQVAGNLSTATHVYQDNGDYQIAATAVDNNGVAHAAAQNPGKLDPAFGGTGTVLNQLDNDYGVYGTESLFYNLSAIDSSGRAVEGGYAQDGDFVLARYDAAGNPDTSFDYEQPALSNPGTVVGLAVDPTTGTIDVAGWNSGGVYVDCFNNDGTPDGDQPYQPSIPNFSPAAVVAQGGEFFVAGSLLVGSHYQPAVACFDQGALVSDFGGGGGADIAGVATGSLGGNFTAAGLAIQPDGGLIVSGTLYGNSTSSTVLVRFTSTGQLDTAYGTVSLSSAGLSNCTAIAAQADGTIVAAGDTWNSQAGWLPMVLRVSADGIPQPGPSGADSVTGNSAFAGLWVQGVAIQPDDQIVLWSGSQVARLAADGSVESDFGVGGLSPAADFGTMYGGFQGVGLGPNGQGIVIAGCFYDYYDNTSSRYAGLARFTTTGLPLTVTAPAALTSPANPATFGQAVTLTATLPDALLATGPTRPTGDVAFMDGTTDLGTTSLTASPGKAMLFNGTNNYVALAAADSALDFTITSQFSVSFWMKSTKTSGLQVIAGNNTDFVNNTAPGWTVYTDDGYLYFQLDSANGFGIGVLQASDLNTQVCNGQWENVVVTYDGSEEASGLGISIDGAAPQTLDTSSSGLDSLGVTSGDPTIGATPAPGNYFYGDLNELDIFNRVLASADFSTLYAGGAGDYGAGGVSGLVAGYHLDNPSSLAIADYSGNGNGGAWNGASPSLSAAGQVFGSVASITTSNLAVGDHAITAIFSSGNSNFANSTSPALDQQIGQQATSIFVTCPTEPEFGAAVTLTATVSPASGTVTPTGDVDFYDGATDLGTASLDTGVATLPLPLPDMGDHGITAVYEGDGNYASSTSLPFVETVLPNSSSPPPTLTLTGNPSVTEGPTGAFTYDYSLGMTYAGGAATVSQWTVDWGDGTTPDVLSGVGNTPPTVYHDYEGAGTYLIQVTATDTAGSPPTTHTYDAMLENDVAGELDQQFASSGSVSGDPGSYSGVAVQPDGSIVAVNPASATNPIVRYDDTGTPDGTTFDDISSAISSVTAVAIQPQAGSFDIVVGGSGYSVARYDSDGSLDTAAFGSGGIATPGSSLITTAGPSCLLVQPDSKIVLAGLVPDGGGYDLDLVRYTANGLLDTSANDPAGSFGCGTGIVDLGAVSGSCDAALESGDQIVATAIVGGAAELFWVGPDGTVASAAATGDSAAIASGPLVATEADGEIILAGLDASNDFAIQTYDSGGNAIGSPTSLSGFAPTALAVEPGGQIVAAGVDAALSQWGLARFADDGTPDTTFNGESGEITAGPCGTPAAMAIDGLGNILVAGADNAAPTDAVLARYTSGGLGVQVTGSAPALATTSIPPASVNIGQTFNLGPVNFTDPDANETHTASVDWGDGNSDDDADVTEPTNGGTPVDGTITDSYSYTATGTYDGSVTVTNSSGVSAAKPFTVNVLPATVSLTDFTSDGTNFDVSYTVSNGAAAPFDIDIYTSADGTTPDQLLMPYAVTGGNLSETTHTVTISPSFVDVPSAYHLIAVSDANGTNSDGTPVDAAKEFSGGIFEAQTVVYVFGTPANDTVTVSNSSITLNSDAAPLPTGATSIHVRTENGNDTVNASPTVATAATLPLWVYGGDGSDTITGGNGGDTIVVGSGQNVIHEGSGWNSPEIVDDSDGVRSGVNNSFQVSGSGWTSGAAGSGFNGSEQVHAKNGSGTPAATWSFANLPATGYYDVYVTWSPQAAASSRAQYVVRDGGGPLTPVGQASVGTVNQSLPPADAGTMYPWSAEGVFWHDLGVFAATQGSTLTVKLEADPNATVLADAVRLVNDGPAEPTTNLTMNSFAVNADGQLAVTYTITGADSPPFSIGIYQSADGAQPTNLVGTIDVTAPDLTGDGAQHTLTYDGDVSGLDSGQYYLARLDAYDQVIETTKADNLSAPLSGVFEDSDGSLYAVTGLDGNSHSLTFSQDAATGDLIVDLDGAAQAFQNAGAINVVAYQGTNSIDAAGVNLPMTIYGGDGSDAITGGDGGNTIYGGTAGGNVIYAGAGADTIYGGGSAGGGHNAIVGGAGSDTIYAGDGGDAITGGTGNDEIYGGAGNDTLTAGSGDNWIQAGSGDDTITGGPDQDWLIAGSGNDLIQGGNGIEVIQGGSGKDTLIGGGGLDNISGGSGTNFIYGNGEHDLLQGGTGKNYILPNPGSGLASVEVKDSNNSPTFDGNIDADGNPYSGDYQADPGYGGLMDWTFGNLDSGVRLGEDTTTPLAVYATWCNTGTNYGSGTHWTTHAMYTVWDDSGTVNAIIHDVDQTQSPGGASPESGDRPWRLLGVWDVPAGDTLHVELSFDFTSGATPQAGEMLCAGDVMIHPLWPTVSIRSTDVTVNSKVASANDGIYEDWFDACNPIDPPVEGQGDRVELQLQASMEQLYTQIPASMGDWHYVLPAVSGLDFWDDSSGGTPLTSVDTNGDLVNDPFPSDGQYTRTVYASVDPDGPLATDAADASLATFQTFGQVTGPGDADVEALVPCTADTTSVSLSLNTPVNDSGKKLSQLDAVAKEYPDPTNPTQNIGIVSEAMQSHFNLPDGPQSLFKKYGFPISATAGSGHTLEVTSGKNEKTKVLSLNAFPPQDVDIPAGTFKYWMFPIAYVFEISTGNPQGMEGWKYAIDEIPTGTHTYPDGRKTIDPPPKQFVRMAQGVLTELKPVGNKLQTGIALYAAAAGGVPGKYEMAIVDETTASTVVNLPTTPLPDHVQFNNREEPFDHEKRSDEGTAIQRITLTPPNGNVVYTETIKFSYGVKFTGEEIGFKLLDNSGVKESKRT